MRARSIPDKLIARPAFALGLGIVPAQRNGTDVSALAAAEKRNAPELVARTRNSSASARYTGLRARAGAGAWGSRCVARTPCSYRILRESREVRTASNRLATGPCKRNRKPAAPAVHRKLLVPYRSPMAPASPGLERYIEPILVCPLCPIKLRATGGIEEAGALHHFRRLRGYSIRRHRGDHHRDNEK